VLALAGLHCSKWYLINILCTEETECERNLSYLGSEIAYLCIQMCNDNDNDTIPDRLSPSRLESPILPYTRINHRFSEVALDSPFIVHMLNLTSV
jgi:hypothetical protein